METFTPPYANLFNKKKIVAHPTQPDFGTFPFPHLQRKKTEGKKIVAMSKRKLVFY
jgi:hypothetical protein